MRKDIDVYSGARAIIDSHTRISPRCPVTSGKIRVRAEGLSQADWDKVCRR